MEQRVNRIVTLLAGAGVGAGLLYLLDPNAGARRRALARDQAMSTLHRTQDFLGKAGRDMRHRARGMAAAGTRLLPEHVSDETLVERVRSKMGRFVSHPRAIDVDAVDGCVTLSGPILTREVDGLLGAVRSVRGVRMVEDLLDRHDTPENIPSLQGGVRRPGVPFELTQENWTPAVRMTVGAVGASLFGFGAMRRDVATLPLALLGLLLLTRSSTNRPIRRMLGRSGAGMSTVTR